MRLHSIMIVDDNETDRYLMKRLLKRTKIPCKIFEAENGKIALDFLAKYDEGCKENPGLFPPQLVFLDINMPIMGGVEFLEHFDALQAKDERYNTVVFAMFTSSEREEDIKKAESFKSVGGFITKGSFSSESLIELLQKKIPTLSGKQEP